MDWGGVVDGVRVVDRLILLDEEVCACLMKRDVYI